MKSKIYTKSMLTKETTAIRSVGYRQAWEYLDGDISYDEFVKKEL